MRTLLSLVVALAFASSPALAMTRHHPTMMGHMPVMGRVHCGSGNPRVWVNSDTHVYHLRGSRYYGHTAHGMYMCRRSAIAAHDHMAASMQR